MDSALPSSSPRARASSTSFLASAYGKVMTVLPDGGPRSRAQQARPAYGDPQTRINARTTHPPNSKVAVFVQGAAGAQDVSRPKGIRLRYETWSAHLGLHVGWWRARAPVQARRDRS